jgi:hypothetical protein
MGPSRSERPGHSPEWAWGLEMACPRARLRVVRPALRRIKLLRANSFLCAASVVKERTRADHRRCLFVAAF